MDTDSFQNKRPCSPPKKIKQSTKAKKLAIVLLCNRNVRRHFVRIQFSQPIWFTELCVRVVVGMPLSPLHQLGFSLGRCGGTLWAAHPPGLRPLGRPASAHVVGQPVAPSPPSPPAAAAPVGRHGSVRQLV